MALYSMVSKLRTNHDLLSSIPRPCLCIYTDSVLHRLQCLSYDLGSHGLPVGWRLRIVRLLLQLKNFFLLRIIFVEIFLHINLVK